MHLTTATTVEASADRSWTIIAERFGDAAEWVSSRRDRSTGAAVTRKRGHQMSITETTEHASLEGSN